MRETDGQAHLTNIIQYSRFQFFVVSLYGRQAILQNFPALERVAQAVEQGAPAVGIPASLSPLAQGEGLVQVGLAQGHQVQQRPTLVNNIVYLIEEIGVNGQHAL